MSKKLLAIVLFIVALAAIAYAVYRAPSETITVVEAGKETVYGSPQHGLNTGLGIFAGICVLSAVFLVIEEGRTLVQDQRGVTKRAVDRLATNYPSS